MRITSVQGFCLHDGPGLRTVIFLAGCPLCCPWCHNPEARFAAARLSYDAGRCIGCRACGDVCQSTAHTWEGGTHRLAWDACRSCLACADACPTGALTRTVRDLSEEELFAIAERQRRLGGDEGGITFSGGEPLLQADALLPLLPRLSVHTAIETSGYADEETFCRTVAAVDLVMMDLKLASDAAHRRYCGVSNLPILRNLAHLRQSGRPYILRTPLIPGITDTEENLRAPSAIVGNDPWELLPYHAAAREKHGRIGLPYRISEK
ncbi:MAG: glycyl-radical enzyme activating protein [Clostridia bacterium]|nr:glycyl-radical enzyme activating protein [Clostridia bacterium]